VSVAWAARPFLRPTAGFLAWPGDPRVRYEPGAEIMASQVAAALPGAMLVVEERLYRPFLEPPAIYVCSSLATFGSYGGDVKSGGYLVNGRVFISPKPENTAERVPRLVVHELTHLHQEQRLGVVRGSRLPVWFGEGLAGFVSGGAGAENVTEAEARRAIAERRVFVPETSAGLFRHSSASTYGMSAHLFYREGAMFLASLHQRDAAAFRRFLFGIEDGEAIAPAFDAAFHETMAIAFEQFTTDVEKGER
jgi:hypothetical protein